MAASSLIAFSMVSLLLVLVPGADWAYAIDVGLRGGPVLPAVGGLLLGYAGLTVAVMAGTAAVVAERPDLLTALTMLGAGYLIWLGVTTAIRPPSSAAGSPAAGPRTRLLRGAGVSGLNPKALLLFLALLPQFTGGQPGSWPLPAQIGVLGLVHMANCAAVYLCVGWLAGAVLRSRPAAARAVGRFSGVAMTVLGVLLLAGRLAGR